MNHAFVSKMIKAKKLELEAIQELLPDKLKANMEEMGDAMKECLKECMVELYFSGKDDGNDGDEADGCHTQKRGEGDSSDPSNHKNNGEPNKAKKITIE